METKLEVSNLISTILNGIKLAKNEILALLEVGLSDYLDDQIGKYYFTNTFLHRGPKVKFDKIYYPITANYGKLNTNFSDLEAVFDEYPYITIMGSAGSGKSTLIKYIFLNSLRKTYRIPVLIELRHLNTFEGSINDYIFFKLNNSQIKPSNELLIRAAKQGAFLFLFDGYDEIFSDEKQKTEREIEDFVDTYPKNRYIITTRPGAGIENTPRFSLFEINRLNDAQITDFINLVIDDQERKNQIKSTIENSEMSDFYHYLRNPLLLSMFILAYENHPEIPNKKSAFYRNVFDTLYSRHDGITKGSFSRERVTSLKKEDFEKILSYFSYLSFLRGTYSFTEGTLHHYLNLIKEKKLAFQYFTEHLIYDLRTTISILQKDGFEYKFPHRSLQEYFSALFISKLETPFKEKAYQNIIIAHTTKGYQSTLNLWSLCAEMDYISYLRYFVIPELGRISANIKGNTEEEMIKSFLLQYHISYSLDYYGHAEKDLSHVICHEVSFNSYANSGQWFLLRENDISLKEIKNYPSNSNSLPFFEDIINQYPRREDLLFGGEVQINFSDPLPEDYIIFGGELIPIFFRENISNFTFTEEYDKEEREKILSINYQILEKLMSTNFSKCLIKLKKNIDLKILELNDVIKREENEIHDFLGY